MAVSYLSAIFTNYKIIVNKKNYYFSYEIIVVVSHCLFTGNINV